MYTGYLIKYNEEGEPQAVKFLDTSLDIEQLNLASAKLLKESGKAGSFTFTVPVTHFSYEEWTKITSYVDLYEDGTLIFSGRVYAIDADFQMNLEITCEGMMTVLNDTLFEPIAYRGPLSDLLEQIMASHNDQVGTDKQILIGNIEYEEEEIVKEYDEYTSTLERLFDLVETFGGFLVVRKEEDGLYLDWLNPDDADEITQKIEFAENLLDITQNESADEVITVLYPMGAERDIEEEDPDLESTIEYFNAENAPGSTEGVTYQTQSPPKSKSTLTLNYEIYRLVGSSQTDTLKTSGDKAVSEITYTIAGTPVANSQVTFAPTIKWVDSSYVGFETFGGVYPWTNKTIPFAKTIQGSRGNKWIVRGNYIINTSSRTIKVEIKSIKIKKTGKTFGTTFMFTGGTVKYYTSYTKTPIDSSKKTLEWFDQTILDGNTSIDVKSYSNTITISNTADGCIYDGSIEYKIDPDYQYATDRSENFSFRSINPPAAVSIYPKHLPTPETMVELEYEIGIDGEACSETIAAIAPSASVASFTKTLTYDPKSRTKVTFAPGIGVEVKGGNPTATASVSFLWENGTYNFSKTFRYSTNGTKVTVQGKCAVNTTNRTIVTTVTSIYNVSKKTWIKSPKIYVTGGSVSYSTVDPDYVEANKVEKRTRLLVWMDQTQSDEDTTVTVNVAQNRVTIARTGNKPYRYDGHISYKTEIDDPRLENVRKTATVESVESKEVEYNSHIFSHTEGDKFIVDTTAVEEYGYIAGYESFSHITKPDELFEEGYKYLSKISHSKLAVSINAVDLVNAGYEFEKFAIDKRVHVISVPHNIDRVFVISKVEIDLYDRSQSILTLDEEVEGYIGRTRHASNRALELINRIYKNYALNKSLVSLASTVLSHTTSIQQNEYSISLRASSSEIQEWINEATAETTMNLHEYVDSAIEISDSEISLISESMSYENKIPFPYYELEANTLTDGNKFIQNGITWTWNTSNNTVKATGTATANSQFRFCVDTSEVLYFATFFELRAGIYTLSGCPEGGSFDDYYLRIIYYEQTAQIQYIQDDYGEGGTTFEVHEDCFATVMAVIKSGCWCRAGLVFKPMLESGTIAHEYRDPSWGAKKMVSEININPGQIRISSAHIDLEGAVTMSSLHSSLTTLDSLDSVTRINGGNIATNTIKAKQIDVNDLNVNGNVVIKSELSNVETNLYNQASDSAYIYHTSAANASKPNAPSTWISPTDNTTVGADGNRHGNQNAWTRIRPEYNSAYPICWITRQYLANNNDGFACEQVRSDETTTVIDGGHITTGTVSANYLDVNGIITRGGIAIMSDVSAAERRASQTASTYITANSSYGGVDFRPYIGSTNYLTIGSSGIYIFNQGYQVASFGSTAVSIGRRGSTSDGHNQYNVSLTSSELNFYRGRWDGTYLQQDNYLSIGYDNELDYSCKIQSKKVGSHHTELCLYSSKYAYISLDEEVGLYPSSDTSGSYIRVTNSYTTIHADMDAYLVGGNAVRFKIDKATASLPKDYEVILAATMFYPTPDNTIVLGAANARWKDIYCATGTINQSDRNYKNSIEDISEKYDKFYDLIKPKTYKFNDGVRTHVGTISQDIEASLYEAGLTDMDFGGFCKDLNVVNSLNDNPLCVSPGSNYIYGLRYEEFIMLNTWQIQKLKTRVNELEQLVAQLKGE